MPVTRKLQDHWSMRTHCLLLVNAYCLKRSHARIVEPEKIDDRRSRPTSTRVVRWGDEGSTGKSTEAAGFNST
eukprot:8633649-Pyramimonas_sp.AAC.1